MWVEAERLNPETSEGRDLAGICAICKQTKRVRYCPKCHAVMCDDCREAYFWRGLAAIKVALHLWGFRGKVWVKEQVN